MRESEKRTPNSNQTKRVVKTERRGAIKPALSTKHSKRVESKPKRDAPALTGLDSNTGSEASEAYDNVVIDFVDCDSKFEEVSLDSQAGAMVDQVGKDDVGGDHASEFDDRRKLGKDDEWDSETVNGSVSSQGDSLIAEDEKVEKALRVDKTVSVKNSRVSRAGSGREGSKPQVKGASNAAKNSLKSTKGEPKVASKNSSAKDMGAPLRPSSESSEGVDDKAVENIKETDALDDVLDGSQSVNSDTESVDADENCEHEDDGILNQKIEEMETRIEKLEEELREVAALEISLYSVVPKHGSSAHKVHTPARRLSRLYIHACKHWTQDKRGTIAKNTTSGLVLIAKSCGNDVPRLTFWLSNTSVLREIVSQAFGSSRQSSMLARIADGNGNGKRIDGKSATSLKSNPGIKQVNGSKLFIEDWQETGTFLAALEKVESWIFSRIVESVWWQALTPHMQPPSRNLSSNKSSGKLLGPALGDQKQGSFSVDLWRIAFQDAFQRLCPVKAGGHDCGCLPVIARMVMEQCVTRLDVAMFNAILRESAHEIPTDPVSDPIVDSRVLPIPAGNLSFGSGAQLKNSVGNWSRLLTDMFGMDADDLKEDQQRCGDDEIRASDPKPFHLLNELSDLLMLPKEMLLDRSIRHEVCPSISLSLVKRILCNFTPDEFCPDAVPGAVLEALNAESVVERRLSSEASRNFPYTAAPVVYSPPCSAAVAEKVAEAGSGAQLSRNVSVVQRKGYTSDEELEELDCPLTSIIKKSPLPPDVAANGNDNGKHRQSGKATAMNARYDLLREVWSG